MKNGIIILKLPPLKKNMKIFKATKSVSLENLGPNMFTTTAKQLFFLQKL